MPELTIPSNTSFTQDLNQLVGDYCWMQPEQQAQVDALLPGLRKVVEQLNHVGPSVTVVGSDVYYLEQQERNDLLTRFHQTVQGQIGEILANKDESIARLAVQGNETRELLRYILEQQPDHAHRYELETEIEQWEERLRGYEHYLAPEDDRGDSEY